MGLRKFSRVIMMFFQLYLGKHVKNSDFYRYGNEKMQSRWLFYGAAALEHRQSHEWKVSSLLPGTGLASRRLARF
jgi:hypothetical protein